MLLMALGGGTFGNGAGSGTVAVALSTILGSTRTSYKQVDIKAPAANTGKIYVGPSTVSATAAYVELSAGESWGLNPQSFTAPAGADFEIDPTIIYIVGTAVNDQAFVVALL